jgi:hypothetical protein
MGCRGRDRMVVGFTSACEISAYHHLSCEFEPCSPELAVELCFAALSVYREFGSKKFWTSKITIREQKIYDP